MIRNYPLMVYNKRNYPLGGSIHADSTGCGKRYPFVLSLYAQLEPKRESTVSISKAAEIFLIIESYPNYHIYIAEHDGEAIGTFSLAIMDNLAHFG